MGTRSPYQSEETCAASGIRPLTAGARSARLSVEGEVVQAGDAEHGVADAVAFEAAVAEGLPALDTHGPVAGRGAARYRSSPIEPATPTHPCRAIQEARARVHRESRAAQPSPSRNRETDTRPYR